jgi:hypothetical protein
MAVPDHSTRISEERIAQYLLNRTWREIAAAVQHFGQSLNTSPNARIVEQSIRYIPTVSNNSTRASETNGGIVIEQGQRYSAQVRRVQVGPFALPRAHSPHVVYYFFFEVPLDPMELLFREKPSHADANTGA